MKRPQPGKGADTGQPRDFYGYGSHPPHPQWPGNARIALNLNLNFETGGERTVLEGDAGSEDVLTDIGFPAFAAGAARWSNPRSSTAPSTPLRSDRRAESRRGGIRLGPG
jgi:hypothetical protein